MEEPLREYQRKKEKNVINRKNKSTNYNSRTKKLQDLAKALHQNHPELAHKADAAEKYRRDVFQSTLPAGEATDGSMACKEFRRDFNPRFPRGKRHQKQVYLLLNQDFNPRFPRGKRPAPAHLLKSATYFNPRFPRGKRPTGRPRRMESLQFQSTLPAGEATSISFS